MTLITEPILGLELIQRAAFQILFTGLNGAITQINDFMAQSDEDLDDLVGRTYVPTLVEPVAPENFYEGHRPSLIDADILKYPNISTWAVRTQPAPESAEMDQMSISRTLLYVEAMCKSAPDEGEGILNRRLLRTVEAVHLVVLSNPTLLGIVNAADGEPSVSISEVFTRKQNTAYGPHWFWQGARVEFTVRKEAVSPVQLRPPGSITRSLRSEFPPLQAVQPETGMTGLHDYSQFIDQG